MMWVRMEASVCVLTAIHIIVHHQISRTIARSIIGELQGRSLAHAGCQRQYNWYVPVSLLITLWCSWVPHGCVNDLFVTLTVILSTIQFAFDRHRPPPWVVRLPLLIVFAVSGGTRWYVDLAMLPLLLECWPELSHPWIPWRSFAVVPSVDIDNQCIDNPLFLGRYLNSLVFSAHELICGWSWSVPSLLADSGAS